MIARLRAFWRWLRGTPAEAPTTVYSPAQHARAARAADRPERTHPRRRVIPVRSAQRALEQRRHTLFFD